MSRSTVLGLALAVSTSFFSAANADEFSTIRQGLAGAEGNYWTRDTIPVCFWPTTTFNSTQVSTIRSRTRQAVSDSWQANSALRFTGYGTCSGNPEGIRIRLFQGRSSANQGPGSDQRSDITLDINASRTTIIHEFGHTLNFGHNHVREDAPGYCIDEPGGATLASVNDQITTYDPYSIMNYCRLGSGDDDLSPLDIVGLIRVYGHNRNNILGMNEAGDAFGQALAVGDLNNDGSPDLAVGGPGEAIGNLNNSGAVFVYLGSKSGALRPLGGLTQDGLGSNEAGDRFGMQVVMGNFDGRPGDELAVAAPFEVPGSATREHGAIFLYRFEGGTMKPMSIITPEGIDRSYTHLALLGMAAGDLDNDGRDELYTTVSRGGTNHLLAYEMTSPGGSQMGLLTRRIYTGSEREVGPGPVLVADVLSGGGQELIVGFPAGRNSAGEMLAGEVQVMRLSGAALTQVAMVDGGMGAAHEARDRFGDRLAAGDFNGDGRMDLAIAATGEDINGSGNGAGNVAIFRGGSSLTFLQNANQNTLNSGQPESEDQFGQALAAGDFNSDGIDDLVITVAGERPGSRTEVPGYLYVALGSPSGLMTGFWVSQRPEGLNEDGDLLGQSLAVADLDSDGFDEVIAGAPGEAPGGDPKSGHVFVFRTPYAPLSSWYSFNQQF